MIRVLIVDDHDLVREGLRALLEREAEFEVVGETGDGQQAVQLAGRLEPDVILMDISLPGGIGGLEAAEAILADRPRIRILVLTQYENKEYVQRALRIGVHGYLLKSSLSSQLRDAILAVSRGQRYLHPAAAGELVGMLQQGEGLETEDDYERLSKREKQVLALLVEGKTSREIARYLNISVKTAMTHRAHVMEKLKLHSRAALIRYAFRKKIIPLDDA